MKSVLLLVLSSTYISYALNLTDPRNKTKRNLSSEVHHYGEPNGVWLYSDNFKPSPAIRTQENFATLPKPLALVGLQPVKVFEPKVAAQQVVYEYQQNPSSNVQVKQVFQPENNFHIPPQGEYKTPVNNSPNPSITPSETIVSPVQHSHMIQHPSQPIINPRIHPLYNVQASYSVQHQPPYNYNVQQPTYNVPRKYAYVNGRLIYDPTTFQLQQQPQQPFLGNFYHVNQPQQVLPRQPVVHYHNNHLPPKPNLIPPPVHQNKFSPPAKHLIQTVDTPSQSPLVIEKETKRKHEDKRVREKEEAEDEDNEKESYEEDESSDEHFGRLRFDDEDDHSDFRHEDDEDDEESERYEDEEEDDNNKRGSKYVVSKYKKHPKKKYNPDKEKSYYYTGKYDYPDEKPWNKGGKNKQKMHYKSVKYSKNSRDPVEGRYSENVPVFHKKKVFKEKWYVSKSHNDD